MVSLTPENNCPADVIVYAILSSAMSIITAEPLHNSIFGTLSFRRGNVSDMSLTTAVSFSKIALISSLETSVVE